MTRTLHRVLAAVRVRYAKDGKLRYLVAGGVNTVFGFAIQPALLLTFPYLYRRYMIGLVIAQAMSLCFAFATYKLTVFRTRQGTVGEFGRFLPFYLINYAVNIVALPLLVEGAGLDPIVAQVGFSIVLMISSYFWHSRITFKPRETS